MLEFFLKIDKDLLMFINGLNSEALDYIMLFLSSKLGWLPLYLFLLYIVFLDYRKKIWLVLIFVGLAVLIADQSSVQLFKNVFQRLRPCHEDELYEKLHMVKGCGGKYGFISSHATNSFAVAVLIMAILRQNHRWIVPVMLVYAISVSYSRIYLGVHYPSDVIAGGTVGSLIGLICYRLFVIVNKRI